MVLCRFFQRGYCKFGDECYFEHEIHVPANTENAESPPDIIDVNDLVNSVLTDMRNAVIDGQWWPSFYMPFINKSFEEARLGFFVAAKNGTVKQYKQRMLREAIMKIRTLRAPCEDTVNFLKKIDNTPLNPPHSNENVFENQNPFENQIASTNHNIFGAHLSSSTNQQSTSPINIQTTSSSSLSTEILTNSPFKKQTTNSSFNFETDNSLFSSIIEYNNSLNKKEMYYKCCKDIVCNTVMCIFCGNSFHRDCKEQLSKVEVLHENRVICCQNEHNLNRGKRDYELLLHENRALRMEMELFRRIIAEKDEKYETQRANNKLLMDKIALIESK